MKTSDIKNLAKAYAQVLEGNMKPCSQCNGSTENHDADCPMVKKEELKGNQHKLDHNKNGKIDAGDFKKMRKEDADEVEEGWDDMMKAAKAKAKEKGTGNFEKKKVSTGTVYTRKANKDGTSKGVKEWTVYDRIQEKKDAHTKGATAPEKIDSTASKGEQEFVDKHTDASANVSHDGPEKHADAVSKSLDNVKVAPKRPGDQTTGDKTPPKAK